MSCCCTIPWSDTPSANAVDMLVEAAANTHTTGAPTVTEILAAPADGFLYRVYGCSIAVSADGETGEICDVYIQASVFNGSATRLLTQQFITDGDEGFSSPPLSVLIDSAINLVAEGERNSRNGAIVYYTIEPI